MLPGRAYVRRASVLDREGSPWFIAKDVCEALGLNDTSKALRTLTADEKGKTQVPTPGGPQQLLGVSEPGFYKLVLKSRKPEARQFQDWVTRVVLPAIRKDGVSECLLKISEGVSDDPSRALPPVPPSVSSEGRLERPSSFGDCSPMGSVQIESVERHSRAPMESGMQQLASPGGPPRGCRLLSLHWFPVSFAPVALARLSLSARLRQQAARLATRTAAALVGLFREIDRIPLSDGECEAEGLPYGSTVAAAYAYPFEGSAPWWHLDCWIERETGHPSCLHLRLLGCWCEVWFWPKAST